MIQKFVNFMWNDSLAGKEGFFANDIIDLICRVDHNVIKYKNRVFNNGGVSHPFSLGNSIQKSNHFTFFYYDPNYECKVALAEGYQIQFLSSHGMWHDCVISAGSLNGHQVQNIVLNL